MKNQRKIIMNRKNVRLTRQEWTENLVLFWLVFYVINVMMVLVSQLNLLVRCFAAIKSDFAPFFGIFFDVVLQYFVP